MNNTPQNISIIEKERFLIESLDRYKTYVNDFLEKYSTDDITFGIMNSHPTELIEGYFIKESEYDTLEEAYSNMRIWHAIRIVDECKFQLGRVCKSVSDIYEGAEYVINLKTLKEI